MDSATSMVAEAALSALFQLLFDILALPFLKRIGSLFGVDQEEAEKLKLTLSRIKALLTDAEGRQIKEESVRLWLSELKDVAYDAEDILDELKYMALQSQLEKLPMQTGKRKLTDQVRVPQFFRFSSNLDLGSRIKEIRERLDEIERENKNLHLKVIHGSEWLIPRTRLPTSSVVNELIVFGRGADREMVVRLLTSDNSSASDSGFQVVPICGMGGLGKTTLAQLAYNDERVKEHFDVSAWVHVSEDFDLLRLTKAIAESFTGSACHLTNLDAIQGSIQKALSKKRFLLVFDDVWNDNCYDWDALRAPLMVGARGSGILVTTRSQRVSSNMGTVPTHFLQGLSDDDCWSLFERRAFVEGSSDAHLDLVKIGKEIVKKCNGLPLAVKTLGGLLHSKVNVEDWKSILESEIWDLPEEENEILPALRLSYHHLPAHLKRCFEFCSIFPKGDNSMLSEELVFWWMALGFIQSDGSKDMEAIGYEYIADLVSRSLLHNEISRIRMHDLIHDVARYVSGAEILEIRDWKSHKNAEKVLHISCNLSWSRLTVESFNIEDLYCFKRLRTLIFQGYAADSVFTIPPDLFENLRHIRILNLRGTGITELPESIGNLKQLRYLDLSMTRIERLPESITRLYNLQALILRSCSKLEGVPNLVNLRNIVLYKRSPSTPFGGL